MPAQPEQEDQDDLNALERELGAKKELAKPAALEGEIVREDLTESSIARDPGSTTQPGSRALTHAERSAHSIEHGKSWPERIVDLPELVIARTRIAMAALNSPEGQELAKTVALEELEQMAIRSDARTTTTALAAAGSIAKGYDTAVDKLTKVFGPEIEQYVEEMRGKAITDLTDGGMDEKRAKALAVRTITNHNPIVVTRFLAAIQPAIIEVATWHAEVGAQVAKAINKARTGATQEIRTSLMSLSKELELSRQTNEAEIADMAKELEERIVAGKQAEGNLNRAIGEASKQKWVGAASAAGSALSAPFHGLISGYRYLAEKHPVAATATMLAVVADGAITFMRPEMIDMVAGKFGQAHFILGPAGFTLVVFFVTGLVFGGIIEGVTKTGTDEAGKKIGEAKQYIDEHRKHKDKVG